MPARIFFTHFEKLHIWIILLCSVRIRGVLNLLIMSKEGSSRHIVLKISESELAYLVDLLDRKLILFDMYRDCNSTRDLLNSGTALYDSFCLMTDD